MTLHLPECGGGCCQIGVAWNRLRYQKSANSKESKEFQRKFKKEKINQEDWKKSGFELLTGTVRIQTLEKY